MSLIGLGPSPTTSSGRLGAEAAELLSVPPGITGAWQCGPRNRATFENGMRQRVELEYVRTAGPACGRADIPQDACRDARARQDGRVRGVGEERPLVTVVIPTCRRPGMLGRALASVLGQTYRNLEVIVADDNVPGSVCDIATTRGGCTPRGRRRARAARAHGGWRGRAARRAASHVGRPAASTSRFMTTMTSFCPTRCRRSCASCARAGLDMSWQDVAWYDERGGLVERRVLDHCRDFSREGLLRAHVLTPISPTSNLYAAPLAVRAHRGVRRGGHRPGLVADAALHRGGRADRLHARRPRAPVPARGGAALRRPQQDRGRGRAPPGRETLPTRCSREGRFATSSFATTPPWRLRAPGAECASGRWAFALRALAASPRACVTKGIEFLASAQARGGRRGLATLAGFCLIGVEQDNRRTG